MNSPAPFYGANRYFSAREKKLRQAGSRKCDLLLDGLASETNTLDLHPWPKLGGGLEKGHLMPAKAAAALASELHPRAFSASWRARPARFALPLAIARPRRPHRPLQRLLHLLPV